MLHYKYLIISIVQRQRNVKSNSAQETWSIYERVKKKKHVKSDKFISQYVHFYVLISLSYTHQAGAYY